MIKGWFRISEKKCIPVTLVTGPYPWGNAVKLRTKTGQEIMALFARLHEAGNTIVLVTHEADVAAFAHRTLHLRDGQVERDVSQAA